MEEIETVLLVLLPIFAGGILLARRIRMAVGMYMAFSLLLSLVWGIHCGGRLAVTELGIGVIVTGLVFYFVLRKLQKEKGTEHESE